MHGNAVCNGKPVTKNGPVGTNSEETVGATKRRHFVLYDSVFCIMEEESYFKNAEIAQSK